MKKFTKKGNIYKLKPQLGISIPLVGSFAALTAAGFIKMPESSFKWWMMAISILLLASFLCSYLIIDIGRKEIQTKTGFLAGSQTIPFEKLQSFTIHKIRQYGLITINVGLTAEYDDKDGNPKMAVLAQSFFTAPIQNIVNDMEEILENEYPREAKG